MKAKFKIVDSIMGSGKTTKSMEYMKANLDKKQYIYVTPFLEQVARVQNEMGETFVSPPEDEYGKQNAFKRFVKEGKNIVTTHSLFLRLDEEAEGLLAAQRYTLVMDEVLDVVTPYNSIRRYGTPPMKPKDVAYMLKNKTIEVDEEDRVHWIEETDYEDFNYSEVKRLAELGSLVCVENALMWEFPPRIFDLFEQVHVLTYWIKGTVFYHYLMYHNVDCEVVSLKDGKVVSHYSDIERRKELKKLITVIDDDLVNRIGNKDSDMSKNWFEKNRNKIKSLKTSINTVLKRHKVKSRDVMWTAYKQDYDRIRDKGYTYVRRLSSEERLALKRGTGEKTLMCYVPCNSRATNEFGDRTFLMYLVNRYWNPELIKFFAHRGVKFNEKECALAEMLQWIWRSAIRNGKPITIYIPSKRMRKLLLDWLDGKD